MKKLLLLCIMVLSVAATYAGGYRLGLQGQRSLAMGHTGVAVVNNAELAFFNPAGLVYLEDKINLAIGASAVFSNVVWQNEQLGETFRTESGVDTPFYAYFSYRANDWISLGLAAYTPYGSSVEWPTDWTGSHLVNNIDLQAIYVQALASVKISEELSVGGGPIYVNGGVAFNRNLTRSLSDLEGNRSNVNVEAKGVNAFGWSLGAMYRPLEKLVVGINYRSKIIMDVQEGQANFQHIPDSPLTPFEDTTFDASLPLPAELSLGLSYQFNEQWLLAFDFNHTYWDVYESLDLEFAGDKVSDSRNPRNYKNASTYRFGFQYQANETFSLRMGYYFDQSPVQSGYFAPETPRNDAQGFTGGLSLRINEKLALDAAFLFNRYSEIEESYDHYQENGRNVPFKGTYKTTAFIPGLGLTYKI